MNDISNLKDTIIPKSDQLNAEQLLSGSMTITVTNVTRGAADQPVSIGYKNDEGRPFKPCKTMRKVLIFAWGDDGRQWIGKSMTLFCDPEVKFGGVKVGGIRISHMSDIERDLGLSLNTTKGKKGEFIIKRLAIRPQAELDRILTDAANDGGSTLKSAWGKILTATERDIFGGTCPDKFKKVAADKDAGIPANIEEKAA